MSTALQTTRPRIALTLGDPSGVGPELVAKLLSQPENLAKADVYVLASLQEVQNAAAEANVTLSITDQPSETSFALVGSELADAPVERGVASLAGGQRAKADLLAALAMYKRAEVDAIMFAPLNKSALHDAGMNEEDELRWFAKELDYDGTTSELNFAKGLTTSRVTSHVSIKEVADLINARAVFAAIELLDNVIKGAGIANPRIAVCALNPHAGENGQFGREEIDHIAPGIEIATNRGINATGPYPCDTIFIAARDGDFDGVVTMYHDQGQIAMKLMGFDQGVTVQGGLPVPIGTPAHGTAYGIVGQGIAHTGPTQHAFDIVVSLGQETKHN